jgi:hypothetical protein
MFTAYEYLSDLIQFLAFLLYLHSVQLNQSIVKVRLMRARSDGNDWLMSKAKNDPNDQSSILRPLPPILSIDILPVILSYLDKPDLARCLRVNWYFFDLAGKALYSKLVIEPVPYKLLLGRSEADSYRRPLSPFHSLRPTYLDGQLQKWLGYGGASPSPEQLILFAHTRELIFHSHPRSECIHSPIPDLLPSVQLLGILILALDHILPPKSTCHPWSCPALASIGKAKDIRIIDIRGDRSGHYPLPLDRLYGPSAHDVTIYLDDHRTQPLPMRGLVTIEWPKSIKKLYLALCRHDGTWLVDRSEGDGNHDHNCKKWSFKPEDQPLLTGSEYTLDIISILLSIQHLQPVISISGVISLFGPSPGVKLSEGEGGTGALGGQADDRAARIRREVRNGFREGLLSRGLCQEAAEARVKEVRFE